MTSFLNNYFGFNKQQRSGLLILCLMSFSLVVVRVVYPYFIKPDAIIIKNLPLFERRIDSSFKESQKYFSKNFSHSEIASVLFVFDPNSVSFDQLIQLGFKEKAAKTFLKFRDKGYVFKQKTDLKKVYGISENFYARLEPYILIENKTHQQKPINEEKTQAEKTGKNQTKSKVELNSTDSLTLLEINGIGPAFAKRILKYRAVLGGYCSVEQLKEVYGFNDELFEKIKPYVYVESSSIKKINLNKDDFKSINKHPYLTYELTKIIFDWRKKTVITAINLKDIINDDSVYKKLLPYIVFD